MLFLGLCFLFGLKSFSQTEYQTYTYPNGQISSEGYLRDGKPDGLWKTYYESGQLKSVGKRTDFLLDSTWVFFAESGDTTLIINYKKDLKNGLRFTFGKEEILEETFVNDVKQGEGHRYDRKHRLIQTMMFKDGFEEGISPVFDTTGLLREIIIFRKGAVCASTEQRRDSEQLSDSGVYRRELPGRVGTGGEYGRLS